jgi:hypothetical protein
VSISPSAVVKRDPRVRKDGMCVVCRKPLVISPRKGLNPALYIDPFCSRACAGEWHKVSEN